MVYRLVLILPLSEEGSQTLIPIITVACDRLCSNRPILGELMGRILRIKANFGLKRSN